MVTSLCFQFNTGIENGSLGFQIKMLSNDSFSFLVDSPSVQALEIRKQFLNFISVCFCELGLETFSSENSESEKKHSVLETETETNVLTERFFSFVDSALKTETEMFAPRLEKPKRSEFGY
ncbi:hypothetical protein C1645_842186 [Glomus cerebriforme]|uniref:Uncharacterized protein n=1 Tax=Glomus cerebriforme TaxID=658196 RepID=A0A397S972_9GLOM|nr:hypothetical protein C1645_842186 [Glomus cerebriforme]